MFFLGQIVLIPEFCKAMASCPKLGGTVAESVWECYGGKVYREFGSDNPRLLDRFGLIM